MFMALKGFQELRKRDQILLTEDAPIVLITQEISRVLGALCQKGTKIKYIFPIINHSLKGGYTENHKQVVTFQWTIF